MHLCSRISIILHYCAKVSANEIIALSQSLCALSNRYDELYHHKKEKSFDIHDKSILPPVHLHAFLS
jgi:hypothetical protein